MVVYQISHLFSVLVQPQSVNVGFLVRLKKKRIKCVSCRPLMDTSGTSQGLGCFEGLFQSETKTDTYSF